MADTKEQQNQLTAGGGKEADKTGAVNGGSGLPGASSGHNGTDGDGGANGGEAGAITAAAGSSNSDYRAGDWQW